MLRASSRTIFIKKEVSCSSEPLLSLGFSKPIFIRCVSRGWPRARFLVVVSDRVRRQQTHYIPYKKSISKDSKE